MALTSISDYMELLLNMEQLFETDLRCDVCHKLTGEPLANLCEDHLFCSSQCVGASAKCPVCDKSIDMANINLKFDGFKEILKIMPKFQREESSVPVGSTEAAPGVQASKQVPATDDNKQKRRASVGSTSTIPDLNKRNKKGETLLHTACTKGDITEVQRLLNAGANCCTRDYAGWTPLHEVAQQPQGSELVKLLLQHGARANVPGGSLNTPLHEAVQAGIVDTIKLLMRYGGDPKQRNLYGQTSRDMARDKKILSALETLPGDKVAIPSITSDQADESVLGYGDRPLLIMDAGLKSEEQNLLVTLTKMLPLTRAKTPTAEVRVVVTAAASNICERSVPVLAGLMVGAWILAPEWLEMCQKNEGIVDPEPFEIYGVSGFKRGKVPRIARTNFKAQMPGLFAGCHFYLIGGLTLGGGLDRSTLTTLVKLAGGVVLSRSPDPENIPEGEQTVPWHAAPDSPLAHCSHYIVYEAGHREPQMKYNMKHIKSLPHTWLLACMENFQLLDPPSQL